MMQLNLLAFCVHPALRLIPQTVAIERIVLDVNLVETHVFNFCTHSTRHLRQICQAQRKGELAQSLLSQAVVDSGMDG